MKVNRLCIKNLLGIFMLWLCVSFSPAYAAKIIASVDRNPANVEESFKLIFTATDTPDGDPDFSPLAQDFDILNQSQSSSSSWDNGAFSKTIRWVLEVTAKKTGEITIPAIAFGNDNSEPLTITVKEGSSNPDGAHANEDIFLEVKASPEQPYVQSQVIYTIRLYRRVDLAQAELSEPELADAVIEKLGEDSNFNTVLNGISYLVTERKYAVFPQKSGAMTIKPLALTAQVLVSQPDFRDFFGSRMTKTKRVLSNEVVLNVKPAPAEFKGKAWLTAEKLELAQEWSGDPQQMKAGEPLTRTLTLSATGTTVGQLPELNTALSDSGLKAYPDKPMLNEQKNPDGVTSMRQEKIAFIPATAGKHVLPAIEIPWFNSLTHKMEWAKIPETVIHVATADGKPAEVSPPQKSIEQPVNPAVTKIPPTVPVADVWDFHNVWFWISVFLSVGWMATTFFLLRKRASFKATENNTEIRLQRESRLKDCVKTLKEACVRNDAIAAKEALSAWGRLMYGAANLTAIAEHADARLRDEIVVLNQMLYGREQRPWSGKKLLQAFTENNAREKIGGKADSELEPLFRL